MEKQATLAPYVHRQYSVNIHLNGCFLGVEFTISHSSCHGPEILESQTTSLWTCMDLGSCPIHNTVEEHFAENLLSARNHNQCRHDLKSTAGCAQMVL